jgi:hypothetical protein
VVARAVFSVNGRGRRRKPKPRHFRVLQAIRDSDLPSNVRHVLRVIEDYADNKTGLAYPSAGRIAKDTGLDERTVKRALLEARQAGWLHRRLCASPDGTNLYIVTPTNIETPWFRAEEWPPDEEEGVAQ